MATERVGWWVPLLQFWLLQIWGLILPWLFNSMQRVSDLLQGNNCRVAGNLSLRWQFFLKPEIRKHYPIPHTNAQVKLLGKNNFIWMHNHELTAIKRQHNLCKYKLGERKGPCPKELCFFKNISHWRQAQFVRASEELCRKSGYIVPKTRNLIKGNLWQLVPILLLLKFPPRNVAKSF